MNTLELRVFEVLKERFNEADAKDILQYIDEKAEEKTAAFVKREDSIKFESTPRTDFTKLEAKIDVKFAAQETKITEESKRLEIRVAETKNELIRWLFGFWVTLVLMMLANWFLKK